MSAKRSRHDRAMALIAVLVVMGGTVLVATSLLFVAQAEIAGSARTADTVRSRALAWSGVQVAIVRLDEQRETILDGSMPRLDEQFVIYETPTRLGVARLLPVGPDGERLVPEAAGRRSAGRGHHRPPRRCARPAVPVRGRAARGRWPLG
jgi:hypothetical protein